MFTKLEVQQSDTMRGVKDGILQASVMPAVMRPYNCCFTPHCRAALAGLLPRPSARRARRGRRGEGLRDTCIPRGMRLRHPVAGVRREGTGGQQPLGRGGRHTTPRPLTPVSGRWNRAIRESSRKYDFFYESLALSDEYLSATLSKHLKY